MIALADCNNFYASCERVFNPGLKDKPIVVLSNNDGCIIARSNEAKSLGIKMGEPVFKVRHVIKKNNVYVFSTNFALYGDMSSRVMSLLNDMSPEIEIYSIDEAFINFDGIKDQLKIASHIRRTIKKSTGIPISIGIAKTKTLAKVANYIAKRHIKRDVCLLTGQDNILKTLKCLPISKIWGIGSKYSRILNSYNIKTAYDFIQLNEEWVLKKMTIMGLRIQNELKGKPCFSIETNPSYKKNICTSRSFDGTVEGLHLIQEAITTHAVRCAEKLRAEKSCARYVSVVLKTNPFDTLGEYYSGYRSMALSIPTNDTLEIIRSANIILKSIYRKGLTYKKAGVIVGDIIPEDQIQLNLFDTQKDHISRKNLYGALDRVNQKMGRDKIQILGQGIKKRWGVKRQRVSPCYTTQWDQLLKVHC